MADYTLVVPMEVFRGAVEPTPDSPPKESLEQQEGREEAPSLTEPQGQLQEETAEPGSLAS